MKIAKIIFATSFVFGILLTLNSSASERCWKCTDASGTMKCSEISCTTGTTKQK